MVSFPLLILPDVEVAVQVNRLANPLPVVPVSIKVALGKFTVRKLLNQVLIESCPCIVRAAVIRMALLVYRLAHVSGLRELRASM